MRLRSGLALIVLLFGGGILLYSAWFYGWQGKLEIPRSANNPAILGLHRATPPSTHASAPDAAGPLSSSPPAAKSPRRLSLSRTHEALLASHRNYTQTKPSHVGVLCTTNTLLPPASTPRLWLDQSHSLAWLFDMELSPTIKANSLHVLTCDHFDPACARWSDGALTELYDLTYAPPDFVPSAEAVRHHYAERSIMSAAVEGLEEEVKRLRKGPDNSGLAQVGVVMDGFVTSRGSIISRDLFIPGAMVQESLTIEANKSGFPSTYQALPGLVEVREVAVIYHVHQDMFYHMAQDQYYRFFALLPYLQQHPDIHIFLHGYPDPWDGGFGDQFLQLCNISKSRIIFSKGRDDVGVKADVIYYTQEIARHETPSLGFAQQLRSGLWSLLAIPHHRPWSSLLDPAKRGAVETFFGANALAPVPGYSADHPLDVNIVVIVRTNHWRGRLIANNEQMKAALLDLATTLPAALLKRTKRSESGERTGERYVRLNYREHLPTTPLRETLELFAQADIVIGPHGAGFVFLAATRPGAHVVELVGGYEQNMVTTARLGSVYHGVVANLTKEGITEGADTHNYEVDIPHLVQLVTSAVLAVYE